MHIRIRHSTDYGYERPTRSVAQMLRVKPRPTSAQAIRSWRVQASADAPLQETTDAFGNIVHLLFSDQPLRELRIQVVGEVETRDTGGVLSGPPEPIPPEAFLRETPLTHCDPALAAFAEEIGAKGGTTLHLLHRTLSTVHGRMIYELNSTDAATTAAQAFAGGRGVCQDLTHVFIAVSRRLGIPARYVSGHFARADGVIDQEAGHAWAEALVPDLGWVGFDVANGISSGEQHVRIAIALDYLGAAPVRGSRSGGGEERMTVRVSIQPDRAWQAQHQRQT